MAFARHLIVFARLRLAARNLRSLRETCGLLCGVEPRRDQLARDPREVDRGVRARVGVDQRPARAHRCARRGVVVHVAEVLGVDREVLPAHAAHREAEPDVLGGAHVVHDDARAECAHHVDEPVRLLGVDRLHLAQEVERSADAPLVALVHRERDHLAHLRGDHRQAQPPVERRAHEGVGVLDRRGLGRDHDDAVVADHEVVHHRGVGPRAEIDEHEVGGERAQRAHEAHAQRVRGLRVGEVRTRRGDQAQVRERRVLEQLAHVLFALGGELGDAVARPRHAERGMEIGALEIAVDGDHAVPGLRQRGGEVRRHEGLADAPFAAAERNQARHTG